MNYQVYIAVSPSNTYYVGITSQGFETRKEQHYAKAFSNRLQTPFYKAIRKYNQELNWFVIAEKLTKKEAQYLEKLYIAKYKAFYEVYNVSPGGELPWNTGTKGLCPRTTESVKKQHQTRKANGYKHSDETKEKIGKSHKGKKQPASFYDKWFKSRNLKSFRVISPEGVDLGIFTNQSEVARLFNLNNHLISACLKGQRKHHKQYTFIVVGE